MIIPVHLGIILKYEDILGTDIVELTENYINILFCTVSLPSFLLENTKSTFIEEMKIVLEEGFELFEDPSYKLEDIDQILDLIWKVLENSSKIGICKRKCRKDEDHTNLAELSIDLLQRLLNVNTNEERIFDFYDSQIIDAMISAVYNFTKNLGCFL